MKKRRQDEFAPLNDPQLIGDATTETPALAAQSIEIVNAGWVRNFINGILGTFRDGIINPNIQLTNIAYVAGYTPNPYTPQLGNINRPYRTIQAGVTAVSDGGTVVVFPGGDTKDSLGRPIYTEAVTINKNITVVGIGNPKSMGYWLLPAYPGIKVNRSIGISGIEFGLGIGITANEDGILDILFDNCILNLSNTIKFQMFNAALNDDTKSTVRFRRCILSLKPEAQRSDDVKGEGLFIVQSRDNISIKSPPMPTYLEDSKIISTEAPIISGFCGPNQSFILEGGTTISLPDSVPFSKAFAASGMGGTVIYPYEKLVTDNRILERIKENQYSIHPAFTSQARLNEYLLKNLGTSTPPQETLEIIDVVGDEPTSGTSSATYSTSSYSSSTYN